MQTRSLTPRRRLRVRRLLLLAGALAIAGRGQALCIVAPDPAIAALQRLVDTDPRAGLAAATRLGAGANVEQRAWLAAVTAAAYSNLEKGSAERAAAAAGLRLPLAATAPVRVELMIQSAMALAEPGEMDAATAGLERTRRLLPDGAVANICAEDAVGVLANLRDRPALAASMLADAYRKALRANLPVQRAAIALDFAAVLRRAGDLEEALALNAEQIAYTKKLGLTYAFSLAQYFRGQMLSDKGAWREALVAYDIARALSVRLDDSEDMAFADMGRCEAKFELGRLGEARQACAAATAAFGETDAKPVMRLRWLRARIALHEGQPGVARALLAPVLARVTVAASNPSLSDILATRAAAEAALGQWPAAYRDLADSRRRAVAFDRDARGRQAAVMRALFLVDRQALRNSVLNEQLVAERRAKAATRRQFTLVTTGAVLLIGLLLYIALSGRRYQQALKRMAGLDALTGLPNRRRATEMATGALAAAAADRRPLTIALIDLDHFKLVNDRFGHAAGDDVLRAFAGLARAIVRQTDLIARWGGEEFLCVFPNTGEVAAADILDRLRAEAARLGVAGVPDYRLCFSAGLAAASDGMELNDIVAVADAALYEAKLGGRDRTVCADRERRGGPRPAGSA